jgi:hypothetical protein
MEEKPPHLALRIIGTVCLLIVVLWTLLIAFDYVFPWKTATKQLEWLRKPPIRLCIGASTQVNYSSEGKRSLTTRSFLLIPKTLESPVILTVQENHRGETDVQANPASWWGLLILAAILWAAIAWGLIPLIRLYQKKKELPPPRSPWG